MSKLATDKTDAGYEVDVVSLDDSVSFSGKALVIKIDVERHELEVLAGMERTLRENAGIVQVEAIETRNDVVSVMKRHGYELVADFFHDLVFEKH